MGIGDIGWSEFLVILILALILLGPRRLPDIASAIGRSLREFRRALNEVQDEFRRETQIPSPWEGAEGGEGAEGRGPERSRLTAPGKPSAPEPAEPKGEGADAPPNSGTSRADP